MYGMRPFGTFFAALCVLACAACDARPKVVLGHVPTHATAGTMSATAGTMSATAGTMSATAGTMEHDGHKDDHDDHDCTETEPVCGSDNVTYLNPCRAAAAGVGVQHAGPC